jgi:hypothetical protein
MPTAPRHSPNRSGRIENGGAFDSLQRLYHDPSEEKAADDVPVNQLPDEYKDGIGESDSSVVVPVFSRRSSGSAQKYAVLQVTRRRLAAHPVRGCATRSEAAGR